MIFLPNRLAVRNFVCNFAHHLTNTNNEMEEKEYPKIEEEDGFGALTAAEPAVAYATNAYSYHNQQKSFDYPDNYDPGIGPYTIEELEARIDRTEQDADDPSKWIWVDDFWSSMRKEHQWLR